VLIAQYEENIKEGKRRLEEGNVKNERGKKVGQESRTKGDFTTLCFYYFKAVSVESFCFFFFLGDTT
jgi:hypothetical protein